MRFLRRGFLSVTGMVSVLALAAACAQQPVGSPPSSAKPSQRSVHQHRGSSEALAPKLTMAELKSAMLTEKEAPGFEIRGPRELKREVVGRNIADSSTCQPVIDALGWGDPAAVDLVTAAVYHKPTKTHHASNVRIRSYRPNQARDAMTALKKALPKCMWFRFKGEGGRIFSVQISQQAAPRLGEESLGVVMQQLGGLGSRSEATLVRTGDLIAMVITVSIPGDRIMSAQHAEEFLALQVAKLKTVS